MKTLKPKRIFILTMMILFIVSVCGVSWAADLDQSSAPSYMPPKPGVDFGTKKSFGPDGKLYPTIKDLKEYPAPLQRAAVSGTKKILVILMEFTDVKFDAAHSQSYWNNMLFDSSNPGSLTSYYKEVSYNMLDVQGVVSPVVTSGHTMAYYGANGASIDDLNGPIQFMAREAVEKLDAAGFDFSQFDLNNDKIVDHLMVIHAGAGEEESASVNDIWSHCSGLPDGFVSADSVKVLGYTTEPETGKVGVFAHEFGHDLGLPDLYDTNDGSPGAGGWSLMASGAWNGSIPGTSPAHLSAWEKALLGWVQPVVVKDGEPGASIPAAVYQPAVYRLWTGGPASGPEYFLVENRQQLGFDSALPGGGLLIWHIDDSIGSIDNNDINNVPTYGHMRVALEEANGNNNLDLLDAEITDPYSSATNQTFDINSNPNSKSYADLDTQVSVRNIGNADAGDPDLPVPADLRVTDSMFITSLAFTPGAAEFSPNGDSVADNVYFQFKLPEAATVTAMVYDSSGTSFVAYASSKDGSPADSLTMPYKELLTFFWNGEDQAGQAVSDGGYRIRIIAAGAGGTFSKDYNVTVDRVAQLTVSSPTDGTRTTSSAVTVYGTVGSNENLVKVNNLATGITGQFFSASVSLVPGENTITVYAEDSLGNNATVLRTVYRDAFSGGGGGVGSGGTVVQTPVQVPMPGYSESKDIPAQGGSLSLLNGKVTLEVPAGAVSGDVKVLAQIAENGSLPATGKALKNVGSIYKITAADSEFKQLIIISLKYDESEVKNFDVEKLGLYRTSDGSSSWEYVGGKVDRENKTISAQIEHFSYYAIMAYEKTFSDMAGHWAKSDVELMSARHIAKGVNDNMFMPERNVTRAEFAVLLARTLGLKAENAGLSFADVDSGAWYYGELAAAYKAGLIRGYSFEKFGPDDQITREQLAAMVARAIRVKNGAGAISPEKAEELLSGYADLGNISDWALGDVALAVNKGIIHGVTATTIAPAEDATRAHAVVMLKRLWDQIK